MAKYVPDSDALSDRATTALATGSEFQSRTLFLVGDVDEKLSHQLLVGLRLLDESPGQIRVVLNSGGGVESDGYAIYDALRAAKNRIVIEAYGACQSIAAVIMQAGDRRLMSREAQFMVHHGVIPMSAEEQQDMVVMTAERIKQENARYHRILARRSKLPLDQVARLCQAETFMSAREAIRYGFADALVPARNGR